MDNNERFKPCRIPVVHIELGCLDVHPDICKTSASYTEHHAIERNPDLSIDSVRTYKYPLTSE